MKIIPLIASAPQLDLERQLDRIRDVSYIRIDVGDGDFLPNITFGMKAIREVMAYSRAGLDIYLLTASPVKYIQELSRSGISAACGHMEIPPHPLEFLHEVRQVGMKVSLALNLSIPVEQVMSYVDSFGYLLFMTSEPDGCDQRFRSCALGRIRRVRVCIPDEMMIYTDGGIGRDELGETTKAGADHVVMGRVVWGAKDPAEVRKEMGTLNGYGTDSRAFRSIQRGY